MKRAFSCDVLVLGAGPAGMAAAAAARENGAEVICVDLFPKPGGQYHMQPPSPSGRFSQTEQVLEGQAAERRCRELGVRFLTQIEIFWVEPGFIAYGNQEGSAVTINASALVVASGAMERALPFKGWTLPGVMTPGGAQRLIKSSNHVPGRNVVLAGTGPFLLAVAKSFAVAGLKLNSYVEIQRPRFSALSLLLRNPFRIGEAMGLLTGLHRTGARLHFGHQVVEALGDERLVAVRVAPLDRQGKPRLQDTFTIEDVDLLCIGYGFRPIIDVTSLLHAEHFYDDAMGGWICKVDATQATSVSGLYAAGETTGIGGSMPARFSGQIAGFHAAHHVGHRAAQVDMAEIRAMLERARRFAAGLAALFPYPSPLIEELPEDEIVCRCEDVRVADVTAALADGADDIFSVKLWTRAGMGPCQGRICGPALAELLASRIGSDVSAAGYNRPHLPLRPVPIDIAQAALAPEAEVPTS